MTGIGHLEYYAETVAVKLAVPWGGSAPNDESAAKNSKAVLINIMTEAMTQNENEGMEKEERNCNIIVFKAEECEETGHDKRTEHDKEFIQ